MKPKTGTYKKDGKWHARIVEPCGNVLILGDTFPTKKAAEAGLARMITAIGKSES
jgi:hypothetical protein